MKRYLTGIAAAVATAGTLAFAPNASAGNSFAVSIGAPGFAVGFSNQGGYVAAYPAPAPVYYAPAPVYYGPTYYYGPPVGVVAYGAYRPWYHDHHAYHGPYRHW